MNKYKKLLKNSGVFAIANLGSKIISILLVPLYTYVLSSNEYGTIDIMTVTISLLLPLVTASIFEATLRFSIKSSYRKSDIFTSSFFIGLIGNLIFLSIFPLVKKVEFINKYIIIFYIILFFQSINQVFAQFARGIGADKVFAFNGVLNTIVTIFLNLIFVLKLNLGVLGYFLSIIISNIICNIYLTFSLKLWGFFNIKSFNIPLIKEMLGYSFPLIPNAIMWWIMNVSDRYLITFFINISANGIYALANKVPTILNVIGSVFFQSWQISAIEEGESNNKSEFYTNVFSAFSTFLLIIVSGILIVIRFIVENILSNEYNFVWKYVPLLLMAVVFSSFATFLGTNYISMKKTKGVFKTTIIGAISNTILNIILIPIFGLNGAAFSTMLSYFLVWLIRIKDTKSFVNIKIDIKNLLGMFFIIILQILVMYIENRIYIIIEILLFLVLIILNKKYLRIVISFITKSEKLSKFKK